jgi:hypothetical protein
VLLEVSSWGKSSNTEAKLHQMMMITVVLSKSRRAATTHYRVADRLDLHTNPTSCIFHCFSSVDRRDRLVSLSSSYCVSGFAGGGNGGVVVVRSLARRQCCRFCLFFGRNASRSNM